MKSTKSGTMQLVGLPYLAALILSGVAFLVGNLFPLINGGFAEAKGLSTSQLGFVSSLFVLSGALVVATAPLWVRRVGWRAITIIAIVMIAAGLLACTLAQDFGSLGAATCLMGVGSGLTQSTVMTGLGDHPNPERAYGMSLAMQMAMQSGFVLLATNYIEPQFGSDGFLYSIAGFSLTLSFFALALPASPADRASDEAQTAPRLEWGRGLVSPTLGLLAIATFMAGILAMWFFMERIGHDAGLSTEQIGLAFALSGVATIFSSGLVGAVGGRISDLLGTAAGILIAVLGIIALGVSAGEFFTIGVCAISGGWGITQPYLWAMTARVDSSRQLFAASPAALGFGGAFGISIGGLIAENSGFAAMAVAAGGLFALTMLAAWSATALHASGKTSQSNL